MNFRNGSVKGHRNYLLYRFVNVPRSAYLHPQTPFAIARREVLRLPNTPSACPVIPRWIELYTPLENVRRARCSGHAVGPRRAVEGQDRRDVAGSARRLRAPTNSAGGDRTFGPARKLTLRHFGALREEDTR